jgi:predicted nucleotidyltransferase
MEDKKQEPNKKSESLKEQMNEPVKYDPKNPSGVGGIPEIPEEALKKADKVKKDLEDFKKKIVKKFPFIQALSVLPAQSFKLFEEDEGLVKEEVEKKPLHLFMLIPEKEFKNIPKKIKPEVLKLVKESKQELWVHIKTEVDMWNYGLDSKYEFVDAIGGSFPLYDKGILGSIRLANIHKNLVMRKFEKYVASYVIAGSLITGTAGKDSDVDTYVIIDDTDVKRMPRMQLLDKLRGMIHDYIKEATALAGVKNPLNVQVSLLTDFWDRVKDAEPVAFTFIRDGVPMYDRGTFLPWKLLLQMGKIKPSPEAVDKFMKSADQTEALLHRRSIDAMVDIYWGVITPTQALMMLAGHAPPTPKAMMHEAKKILVEEEKVMSLKDHKYMEKMIKYYKDYEHGKLKFIPGKEIDEMFREFKEYEKKLKEMRKKLEEKLIVKDADKIHSEVFDLLERIFGKKSKELLIREVEHELIKKGKLQKRFLADLNEIVKVKQKIKSGKLSTLEMNKIRRNSVELINELVDYAQRVELVATEKSVIQVMFGDKLEKIGELVLTDSLSYFVEAGRIMEIESKGFKVSNREKFEKAIKDTKDRSILKLNSKDLVVLEKELGNFELNI